MPEQSLFDGSLEALAEQPEAAPAPLAPEPQPLGEGADPQTPETEPEAAAEESFFDLNTVPQELLPAYKQMQAAFTKRQQESAESKRKWDEVEKSLPQLKQSHEALTKLVTDPQYRAAVFGAAQQQPQAQAAQETPQSFYGVDVSKLENESQLQVKELAAQAVMEKFSGPIRQMWQEIQTVKQQLALSDWQSVLQEHPQGQEKLQDVSSFLAQNPNFFSDQPQKTRFQKALRLFVDDPPAQGSTRNKPVNGTPNNADRRAAQVAKPGLPAGNAKPTAGTHTLAELLKIRSRELGITWPDG